MTAPEACDTGSMLSRKSLTELLKVVQVAKILNLKPKTVRLYIRQGRLPAVNLNPDGLRPVWRIKASVLEDLQTGEVDQIVLDLSRRFGL